LVGDVTGIETKKPKEGKEGSSSTGVSSCRLSWKHRGPRMERMNEKLKRASRAGPGKGRLSKGRWKDSMKTQATDGKKREKSWRLLAPW